MKSHKHEMMTDRASLIGQEDLSNRLEYTPGSTKEKNFSHRVSTGVAELDEILHGGFISRRAYLVRGDPGCGKTTLGVHFLCAGAKRKNQRSSSAWENLKTRSTLMPRLLDWI